MTIQRASSPATKALDWITPTLLGGWTEYVWPPAYAKTYDGLVVFRGAITVSGGSPWGAVAFTLPVGYRPPGRLLFESGFFGRIDILANGDFVPSQYNTAPSSGSYKLQNLYFVPAGTT